MAQIVITQLVDDLTGDVIPEGKGETVSFALDDQPYTIDLSTKNAQKMRAAFAEYLAAATKVGRQSSRTRRATRGSSASAREVRDWARSNGYQVPDRGRIPATVREAFETAK